MLQAKPGVEEGARAEGLASLGARADVLERLGRFNTAPDGRPRKASAVTDFLYGPGFVAELATAADPITQIMVTLSDESIALPVLMKLCKVLGWQMVDLESGRTFG